MYRWAREVSEGRDGSVNQVTVVRDRKEGRLVIRMPTCQKLRFRYRGVEGVRRSRSRVDEECGRYRRFLDLYLQDELAVGRRQASLSLEVWSG